MLQLPHHCRAGRIAVFPKNWKEAGASLKKDWYIHYRFYDASGKNKQILIKGMNRLKTLAERRAATQGLLQHEVAQLEAGWNPILRRVIPLIPDTEDEQSDYIINPNAGFNAAIYEAWKRLVADKHTIACAKTVVKYVQLAATDIRKGDKPISSISRRHILQILDQCAKQNPRWSANQFNVYRSNLHLLYRVLVKVEAVDSNIILAIEKAKTIRRLPVLLQPEQRQQIAKYVSVANPAFWNYIQIFFHSGSRTKELLRLRVKDVDLVHQRYKCIVMKRQQPVEVWRPIKDIAVPFWQKALQADDGSGTDPHDYVFGKGLKPGPKPAHKDYVPHKWQELVKRDLGIQVDFYKLKHLNINEISALLDIHHGAKMAEHTTPVVTMRTYAVGEADRQAERLKKVSNPFI